MSYSYRYNQMVEIYEKKEGPYYRAKIIGCGQAKYLVRYETVYVFVKKGERKLKTAAVDAAEIRPDPPRNNIKNFNAGDRVDVSIYEEEDSWWVGFVLKRCHNGYIVKLESNGNEVHCETFRIRRHFDFDNGQWISNSHRPAARDDRSHGTQDDDHQSAAS
ncbi:uncharacterized protein LOC126675160 [Mercurialis annua]|uniref:uncharacterized protein LOC126675160 n=1 Tax=Mercurialis annua TaxID=3986 RepID=UPI00215EB05B|nr:uncharacterized protein LOC126675160 [Mercurialis annua]